jgi:hypothetical protein
MKRIFIFVFFSFFAVFFVVFAQHSEMYRLTLKDKGISPYSIAQPEKFLSKKSIDRRIKQGFAVNETDLPIDSAYFNILTNIGADIRTYSKWTNTIVINVSDSNCLNRVLELPFVKEVKKVWQGDLSQYKERYNETDSNEMAEDMEFDFILWNDVSKEYGNALIQMKINNALPLHEQGCKGEGKIIAVIDGGFSNADKYSDFLDMNKILGTKNFTHQTGNLYRGTEWHGVGVLSCMLADCPGKMIGTAPQSQFYLLKTEVVSEEYPVEEDYWVAALEYADSIGADIVTSSLGYSEFNETEMNHTWSDLDGYTVPASRAASMAASKGMILFASAGNEGADSWQKTAVPADAKNILTVGAVKPDSTKAHFSSWGRIADNRIKPDVMALGEHACVLGSGNTIYINGTSFATPVLAGMSACLWEALPYLTSYELMDLIKESSDRYSHPDEQFGYGIPNMYEAYLKEKISPFVPVYSHPVMKNETQLFQVDSTGYYLYLQLKENDNNKANCLTIYSCSGEIVFRQYLSTNPIPIGFLSKGMYIGMLQSDKEFYVQKFVK